MLNEPYAIIYAPEDWVTTPLEERKKMVNGCGPGGWLSELVPESMYGIDVTPACNVHDFMYLKGQTIQDKEEADRVFLNNMLRIINHESKCFILRWLRRRRALKYYLAVKHFGGPFFWEGKNADVNHIWATPKPKHQGARA